MEINNVNPQFDRAVQDFKKVVLQPEEKARMRRLLMAHMNAHPVQTPIPSPLSVWFLYATRTASVAFVALFAVVGSSYAASGALPGQTLYPVKVGLNERVESFLAVSDQSSAEVSFKHALTRLEEVEKLAAIGALDATTNATVRARFQDDVAKANRQADTLVSKGEGLNAASMRGRFEQHLDDSFGRIVGIAATSSSATRPLVADIAYDVKAKLDATSRKNISVEKANVAKATKTVAEASARRARDAAILAIGVSLTSPTVQASDNAAAATMMMAKVSITAPAQLVQSKAQKLVDSGNKKLAEGKFAQAYALFKSAERAARDDARLQDLAPDVRDLLENHVQSLQETQSQKGSSATDSDDDNEDNEPVSSSEKGDGSRGPH